MLYANTLATLVNNIGIGTWEEENPNKVWFETFEKNGLEFSIERNYYWGDCYKLYIYDIYDGVGESIRFESLEHACQQAVAYSQGEIAYITADPTPLGTLDPFEYSFNIRDDKWHVEAISESGLAVYPLKRIRLHQHGDVCELKMLTGSCPSCWLSLEEGDQLWSPLAVELSGEPNEWLDEEPDLEFA